jgi:copper chaperone
MEILKFKTTVADQHDIARIAPGLAKVEGIAHWKVTPETEENILSVVGINLDPQLVENAVKAAGFGAELLRVQGIGGEDL